MSDVGKGRVSKNPPILLANSKMPQFLPHTCLPGRPGSVGKGSPPRMKIAGLFSGESPMRVGLTTTYENGIFGGVSEGFLRHRPNSPQTLARLLTGTEIRQVNSSSMR